MRVFWEQHFLTSSSSSSSSNRSAGQLKAKQSQEPGRLFSPESLHACTGSVWGLWLRAGFPAPLRTPMNSPFREIVAKPSHWRTGPSLVSMCPQTHSNTYKHAHKVPLRAGRQVWVWVAKEYSPVFPPSLYVLRLTLGELNGVLKTKISTRKKKSVP